MLFNIAAELLSLANACGVFKAFIDGEMWSFETSKVKGHSSQSFSFLTKMLYVYNSFSPNFKFLRLSVFKILHFEICCFPISLMLLF